MDSAFIYDTYVTGKNFIARKSDLEDLQNAILHKRCVSIYAAAKSGKKSLIKNSLQCLYLKNIQIKYAELSLISLRQLDEFLIVLLEKVIRAFASTPLEYKEILNKYLCDTCFFFDEKKLSNIDSFISINGELSREDILSALSLAFRISKNESKCFVLLLEEFQNIDFIEQVYELLHMFKDIIMQYNEDEANNCVIIFSGSSYNAMKDIFEKRRLFTNLVSNIKLSNIEESYIVEHISQGFLKSGKVMEKESIQKLCTDLNNNIYYIQHAIAICDYMSKGYIVDATVLSAMQQLISIHEPRFRTIMNSLTNFQFSLLKAIIDGHRKFSAVSIIKDYNLNSSANVKRLKDALMKKEIISFSDDDEARFLDPLFEYWLRKIFFKK